MTNDELSALRIKIFADGASIDGIQKMSKEPWVSGFTTNPTLMRKVGITNYEDFARAVISHIQGLPISLEVFSDDFEEMARQAKLIASWGENVYVKVPVTDTSGASAKLLITQLSSEGINLNVTAVMTSEQVAWVSDALADGVPAIVSVFAGRIADTGRDPIPIMVEALDLLRGKGECELLWASPREVLNLMQAEAIGCQIITMTNDLLAKLDAIGKDLDRYSLETVQMFYRDAEMAGFAL
jgi:transaldolase